MKKRQKLGIEYSDDEIINALEKGRFLKIYQPFLEHLSPLESLLLTYLIQKQNHFKKNGKCDSKGYFYRRAKDIRDDTGLSEYQQKRIREVLVEKNLLYNTHDKNLRFKVDLKSVKKFFPSIKETLVDNQRNLGHQPKKLRSVSLYNKNNIRMNEKEGFSSIGKGDFDIGDLSKRTWIVFRHWNRNCKSLKKVHSNTKIGETCLEILETQITKQYSVPEILTAMTKFDGVIAFGMEKFDLGYTGTASLKNFLIPTIEKPSWLDLMLERGAPDIYFKGDKIHSEVVKKLQYAYVENVLNDSDVHLSPGDRAKIFKASEKLFSFMLKRSIDSRVAREVSINEYITVLFRAIKWGFKMESLGEIVVGNLCSDYTFNNLLPRYINKEYGRIE